MRARRSVRARSPATRRGNPVLGFVILGAVSVLLLGMSIPALLTQRALDARGRATTGTILSLRHTTGRGSRTWARYSYTVGDSEFTGTDTVPYDLYRQLRRGDPISVTYLPDAPGVSRTDVSTAPRSAYVSIVFGILTLAVAAVTLRGRVRGRGRSRFTARYTTGVEVRGSADDKSPPPANGA